MGTNRFATQPADRTDLSGDQSAEQVKGSMIVSVDPETKQFFMVEEVEPGQFQAIFPARLADYSCFFDSEQAARDYIAEVQEEEIWNNSQFGVGA
jgi:hypothetical protein